MPHNALKGKLKWSPVFVWRCQFGKCTIPAYEPYSRRISTDAGACFASILSIGVGTVTLSLAAH